jgi:glycosyltransferase involved in cell wall biosynthesis
VKAVRSVLAQSFQDFEIVVTVDGRDDQTVSALRSLDEPRLRTLVPDRQLGNAQARNHAIAEAKGELIALLDDDDLWMEGKLARQVETLDRIGDPMCILSCPFRVMSENENLTWPRRYPSEGEPVSEFIFCRNESPSVEGAVQTSTLLAARSLFETTPFDASLPRLVDLDWLLRAADRGAYLAFPRETDVLSVYAVDDARKRVSHGARWRWEREWALEREALFTPRSLAAFLLTSCSLAASRAGDLTAFLPLLRSAYRHGTPSRFELAFHVANTALPLPLKQRIAAALEKRQARR